MPVSPSKPQRRTVGKSRQLAYMTSVSVDPVQHVITHIQAASADRLDSRNMLPTVDLTQGGLKHFGVVMSNVVADAAGPPSRLLLRREL